MKTKTMLVRKTILFLLAFHFVSAAFSQTPYYPLPDEGTKATAKKGKAKPAEPPKQNIFKLNMLSPMYSTIMVFYQRNLQENNSLQLGFGYMDFNTLPGFLTPGNSYSGSNNNPQDEQTTAFFFTPEYRYMLIGDNMNGLFVAPFAKYTKMDYSFSSYNYFPSGKFDMRHTFNYQSLGVGIIIGQQWVLRNKISLELFAGTVYNTLLSKKMSAFPTGFNVYGKSKWDQVETSQFISTANIRGYGIRAGFTVGFLF
jgi:hypothetical protein